jgi:hypothetical protein
METQARSGLELEFSHVSEHLRERVLSEFNALLERDGSTAFRPYGNVLLDESQWAEVELNHWRSILGDDRRQREIDAALERANSLPEESEERRAAEGWLCSLLGGLCDPAFYDARRRSEGPLSEPMLELRAELERRKGDAREEFEREATERMERDMASWMERVRSIQPEDRTNEDTAAGTVPDPSPHRLAEWSLAENRGAPTGTRAAEAPGVESDRRTWAAALIVALAALVLLGAFRRPLLGVRIGR